VGLAFWSAKQVFIQTVLNWCKELKRRVPVE
jgi:hypothetical protein